MTKVLDNLSDKRIEWVPFSDQVMGGISEINFLEKKKKWPFALSYGRKCEHRE